MSKDFDQFAFRQFEHVGYSGAAEGHANLRPVYDITRSTRVGILHTHAAHIGHCRRAVIFLRLLSDHGFGRD